MNAFPNSANSVRGPGRGEKKNWDKDKRKHPGGERGHAVVQALTQDTATSVIHPLVDTSTETLCVKLQAA